MVHSHQVERAHPSAGQQALRNAGEIRLPDGALDDRLKDKPARRRGGKFTSRARPSAMHPSALHVSPSAHAERSTFEGTDLLTLLAHQLLTPLALIDTAAQRMARRADEMEAAEIEARASRIRAASASLSALAHAVLSRAKLGDGSNRIDVQACRVSDLLVRTRDYVECLQPCRRLLMSAPQIAEVFWADPLLIEQAFMVLVCNAMKYSPQETEIEVTGRVGEGFIALSVRDHGIGVPAEDIFRIFDPFFRSHNASTCLGTGLGLNLADRIARLHGGWIEVESEEGKGATFTIRLPSRPQVQT